MLWIRAQIGLASELFITAEGALDATWHGVGNERGALVDGADVLANDVVTAFHTRASSTA